MSKMIVEALKNKISQTTDEIELEDLQNHLEQTIAEDQGDYRHLIALRETLNIEEDKKEIDYINSLIDELENNIKNTFEEQLDDVIPNYFNSYLNKNLLN